MFTLIVPKNSNGMEAFKIGKDDRENQSFYDLSEEEYETLRMHKVFDILNRKFDLWIDEGEEETITATQLKEAFEQITPIKGIWKDAITDAISKGTCIYLVF